MWDWVRSLYLSERIEMAEAPGLSSVLEASEQEIAPQWQELAVARYVREGKLSSGEAYGPLGVDKNGLRLASKFSDPQLGLSGRIEPPAWVHSLAEWSENGRAPSERGDDFDFQPEGLSPSVCFLFQRELSGFWALLQKRIISSNACQNFAREPVFKSLLQSFPCRELNSIVMPSVVEFLQESYIADSTVENGRAYTLNFHKDIFINNYPVVYRQLYIVLNKWQLFIEEILDALENDLDELHEHGFVCIGDGDDDVLTIQVSEGDTHDYGKSVARIQINERSVFYKPYPPYGKECFECVVGIVGKELSGVGLVPYLDRSSYFWEMKVEQSLNEDELPLLSKALGSFSALVSVLGGSDFHHENVFFSGGKVVPVDLETILHPSPERTDKQSDPGIESLEFFQSSIATKGIIPFTMVSNGGEGQEQFGVDISVIGLPPKQAAALSLPYVSDDGDGGLQLTFERPLMLDESGLENRSKLLLYEEEFMEGYENTFVSIQSKSVEILQAISELKGLSMRYVARPTMLYNKVLLESYHPEFTKDSMKRLACLYKLGTGFLGESQRDALIHAELSFLLAGDTPRFNSTVNTGVIWSAYCGVSGKTRPLLDDLSTRIRNLDKRELEYARVLVNHSFRLPEVARTNPYSRVELRDSARSGATLGRTRSLIDSLATRLVSGLGFTDTGRVVALEMTAVTETLWTLSPAGFGLYNGLSGIALGLFGASSLTDNQEYYDVAEQILLDCGDSIDFILKDDKNLDAASELLDFGFFGVTGGLLLSCYWAHEHNLAGAKQEWCTRYQTLLDILAGAVRRDKGSVDVEIISGLAGSALLLTKTMHMNRSATVHCLSQVVEILVERVEELYFDSEGRGKEPDEMRLVGFAHGSDGILYAISRTLNYLPGGLRERTIKLLKSLFAWEREVVRTAGGIWDDYRENSKDSNYIMNAWCHGATGAMIAMKELSQNSYLSCEERVEAKRLQAKAESQSRASLNGSSSQLAKKGFSLCHSKLSNALLLLENSNSHDDEILRRLFENEVKELEDKGWLGGGIEGVQNQGLMLGLAGTIFMLAAYTDPGVVPDVLQP